MDDEAWSISQVLGSTGHGRDWDKHHVDDDDVAPTFDNTDDMDVIHPQTARQEAGLRRAHASMMAKSKDNVTDILRSVSPAQALEIQGDIDEYVRFRLGRELGETGGYGNPTNVPKKGRPKKPRQKKRTDEGTGNPEGQKGKSLKKGRYKDTFGAGSGKGKK